MVETGDGPETESDEDVPLRRDWYTGDIARFWTCPYHNCDAQFEHANACIDHFQNTHLSSISSPRPERLQCTLLLCVKSIDESWKVKTQLVKHQLPKNQDKRAPKKATGFSFGKRLRSLFGYSDDSEEETQPTKKRRRTLTLRRHGIRQVCRTYVQESNISGTGVFAESLITEGMVIAEYSGEPISNAVADRRERGYRREGIHNYLMRLNEDTVIDPSNDDGIAKLINHSCDPNCKAWTVPGSAREDVETVRECIDIVALRVINQGKSVFT